MNHLLDEIPFGAPRLSDSPEETADWAECWTLVNKDGNTSFSEIRSTMEIGGSADAYVELEEYEYTETRDEDAPGSKGEIDKTLYEAAVEATFMEISDRINACGETIYPFEVTSEAISVRDDTASSVYTFLLLLSKFGPDAGSKKNEGAKLFEEICANAVKCFLGGDQNLADALVFGFPRRVSCKGFANALDDLCRRLAEGEGCKNRPTTKDQKDAKLDVVGWKSFRDRRKGRLILFGQCGTGGNWKEKRSELIPTSDWCSYWMRDRLGVWPLRAFFVPHRIGEKDWFETCVHGGLLFDRCRLVSHVHTLRENVLSDIMIWSKYVVEHNCGS